MEHHVERVGNQKGGKRPSLPRGLAAAHLRTTLTWSGYCQTLDVTVFAMVACYASRTS